MAELPHPAVLEPFESGLYRFDLESYGVHVRIQSNDHDAFEGAVNVARRSLLGDIRENPETEPDHIFELNRLPSNELMLIQNGNELGASDTALKAYRFFDSILRVTVGETAPYHVFLHAGVVAWKGRAIVMPADSFKGKSTLVAELVRAGADYYSDDFAILDEAGLVHPFPRKISMRSDDFKTFDLTLDDLGGKAGVGPAPIGLILLTEYAADGKFVPVIESPGSGVLKLIPFTLTVRRRPEFSLMVLHKVAERAIIASSLRGSAERFAKTLLDFVDNRVN